LQIRRRPTWVLAHHQSTKWLRGRLDVSGSTARDLVDLSRALADEPRVRAMADAGQSFDRLAATAGLIAAGADNLTIERSKDHDIAGTRRLTHRERRMARSSEAEAFRDRSVVLQDSLDGSRGRVSADLPGFEYSIVGKALTERAEAFGLVPGTRIARPQRMADALVSISQDSLDPDGHVAQPGEGPHRHGRVEPLVTLFVDLDKADQTHGEAGAEVAYGPQVGPLTLERLLCTGRVRLVGLADGRPVAASTAARAIPPAIRDYVAWRDGAAQPTAARAATGSSRTTSATEPTPATTIRAISSPSAGSTTTLSSTGLRLDPDSPPHRKRFLRLHRSGADPP